MAGKIALIDGNALVHRAFHALPPLTSPKGELVNATYGVATMLLKVLQEMHPEYAVAAFDTPVPTFRHVAYHEYKGTRGPAPEGLHEQFGRVHELLDAMGIPTYRADGFEADDLLGTMARQAREAGLEVVIVTGDTDALQLVAPGVTVLTSRKGFTDTVLYDEAAVRERYGVDPPKLVELKALKGDTSDNIPGVPGVGEKTASKLVCEYGDLEGIYANLDKITGKLKQQLEQNRDQAFFSRHLGKIVTDAPVELEPEKGRTGRYDRARLVELFRELGFKTLVDRIPREETAAAGTAADGGSANSSGGQLSLFSMESPASKTRAAVAGRSGEAPAAEGETVVSQVADERDYRVVSTTEELDALVELLRAAPVFSFDLETTGVDALKADLVGLSFSVMPAQAFYVPVGHRPAGELGLGLLGSMTSTTEGGDDEPEQLPLRLVLERLRSVLEDEHALKCAHNGKYDMLALARYGVYVRGLAFDSMVAAYLLESTQRTLGLKDLAWSRLNVEMEPYQSLAGKGKAAVTLDLLPIRRVADYSCADADMTLRLMHSLKPELEAKGVEELFERVEMPLVPVLVDMECEGVALDVPYLQKLST
jgi:DNA polymerase I